MVINVFILLSTTVSDEHRQFMQSLNDTKLYEALHHYIFQQPFNEHQQTIAVG